MAVIDDPDGWRRYNATQTERPPRQLVLDLLAYAGDGRGRHALDLGFGSGVDTEALLRHGWSVLAIDADPSAAELLTARAPDLAGLTVRTADFTRPLPGADLVHAAWSLPYAGEDFPQVWSSVRNSLRPGGWLGCQLFGDRDTWAPDPRVATRTAAEVRTLLDGLDVVRLDEVEQDGDASDGPWHWHVFTAIARKTA